MKEANEKPPEKDIQTWLNERQVAEITGLSVHTLRSHRQHRTGIPYAKIGRAVRYSSSVVANYMTRHQITL